MPIVRLRSQTAVIGVSIVLVIPAACGGDDTSSGVPVTAVATAPQVDEVDSTTTSSTSTAPTSVPATTASTTTEAPEPDRITRAEAEALAAAGLEGAEMLDASAFVAALGETGAFITVDGRSLAGDELIGYLEDAWALGNTYSNFSELEETPQGFLQIGERVLHSGQVEPLGLEYRRNAAGDYLIFQIDPVLVLGDRGATEDSGLTVDEAEAILTEVTGTFDDREWSRAVDALGPDGAWVEPTFEVPAEQIPEFFESYVDIDRIEITGPGVPSSGGFVFPVTDHLVDGTVTKYFMMVTTNAAGALRLIYQPALPVDTRTPPTTGARQ